MNTLADICEFLIDNDKQNSKNSVYDDYFNLMNTRDVADTIDEFLMKQTENTLWKSGVYKDLNLLKPDYTGQFGEKVFYKLVKKKIDNIEFHDERMTKDGTYDMKINNMKVEIKTARIGNKHTFQYENLHSYGCDIYVLLSFLPNKYYISIFPKKESIQKTFEITGRKVHLRKDATDKHKITLSYSNLQKMNNKRLNTLCVDKTMSSHHLDSFLKQFFNTS